jgi:hypothetical protein
VPTPTPTSTSSRSVRFVFLAMSFATLARGDSGENAFPETGTDAGRGERRFPGTRVRWHLGERSLPETRLRYGSGETSFPRTPSGRHRTSMPRGCGERPFPAIQSKLGCGERLFPAVRGRWGCGERRFPSASVSTALILAEAVYSELGVGCVGVAPLSVSLHGDSVKITKEYGYVVALDPGGEGTVTSPFIATKQTCVPAGSPTS